MTFRKASAAISLMLFSACAAAQTGSRVEIEVPPAQHLAIVDDVGRTLNPSASVATTPLTLTLPVGKDGSILKPTDLDGLITTLWEAVSPEYRQRLAAYFGFSRGGSTSPTERDLRLVDLASYLYDVFELGDRATLLGRQITCVSSGERDLTPVFALVVQREILSNDSYTRRRDLPQDVTIHSALRLASRLAFVCRNRPAE